MAPSSFSAATRDVHAPAGDVAHHRLADQLGEAGGEGRARHRQLVGERGHGPVPGGVAVDERDGAADLGVAERSQPAALGGRIALDPGADRLDHQDVAEARDHRLAAGPQLAGLGGHQPQHALHPFQPGRAGRLDVDRAGQDLDQVARRGVLEAHGSADQAGRRAAPAVAEDLVAVADVLALEVEDPGRRSARFAAKDVALAVRHEREISELDRGLPSSPVSSHIRPEVTTWNQR